jgi:hypothetical protein
MAFIYTQDDLQRGMNRGIQGKEDILIDAEETMNEAVREVLTEVRIRSTRRSQPLVPNLMNGPFEYTAITDILNNYIIDIPENAKRFDGEFTLVPSEQFARNPHAGDIALKDANGIRTLLIHSDTNDSAVSIDPLSTVGSSDWRVFGDGTNIDDTSDDAVKGNESIEFDISAAGGTTAGIYNDSIDSFDLTEYISHPAYAFTYARVTSTTGLTNYKLRLGSSASDYYEFTVTTRSDGSAFTTGWNPLRFDLSSPTTTGSPTVAALTYAALFMTKATTKVSESGYMFNFLEARKGKYAQVSYYSKYGWQTSAGVYKENSTDSSDLLVADTDEFDLFVKKARVKAGEEVDLPDNQLNRLEKKYFDALANYLLKSPSEEKTVISSYHDYSDEDVSASSI